MSDLKRPSLAGEEKTAVQQVKQLCSSTDDSGDDTGNNLKVPEVFAHYCANNTSTADFIGLFTFKLLVSVFITADKQEKVKDKVPELLYYNRLIPVSSQCVRGQLTPGQVLISACVTLLE